MSLRQADSQHKSKVFHHLQKQGLRALQEFPEFMGKDPKNHPFTPSYLALLDSLRQSP